MNRKYQVLVALFLVLALLGTAAFGCGGGEEGKTVITIGVMTDMTGPAQAVFCPLQYAIEDLTRYYNEENLIPNVKLKVVTYDTQLNPSRDIPGYNWLRGHGAQIIIDNMPWPEAMQPFASRDKVPLIAMVGTKSTLTNPPFGWLFSPCSVNADLMKTLLKWISENDWDYQAMGRKPKIGSVSVPTTGDMEDADAVKEYCQDNPDQFEYVAGFVPPITQVTWTSEIKALKDCDYVVVPGSGTSMVTFVEQFRSKGCAGKFISEHPLACYVDLLVRAVGWKALDGSLSAHSTALWWGEESPIVDLAQELLQRYRSGQAEDIIRQGIGYIGGFHQIYFVYDVLRQAVKNVGVNDFDSQAFYNTAISFKEDVQGYTERGWTDDVRYAFKHGVIYRWSAESKDLVRVSDWLPIVVD
jgi:ABC-type branched-subunit amino acid transport system substrate-binding protein